MLRFHMKFIQKFKQEGVVDFFCLAIALVLLVLR